MVDEPLFSIVTVTLNDRDGLRRTVKSLQVQEDAPTYEQIVIDGVSNYNVSQFLEELNASVILHRGKDQGLYDAMNIGMRIARGKYIIFLNSGDILATKSVLSTVAAQIDTKSPDIIFGDSFERRIGSDSVNHKPARPFNNIAYGMITHHQSIFFRRTTLVNAGIEYDCTFQIAADYDFVLKLYRSGATHKYLPVPVCEFEEGGVSYTKSELGRIEQFQIRRKAYRSLIFAVLVYVAQRARRKLRAIAPDVYWGLVRRGRADGGDRPL